MTHYAKKSEWAAAKAAEIRALARAERFRSSGGSWRRAKRKFEGIGYLDREASEWDRWARYYVHEETCAAWQSLERRLVVEGRTLTDALAAGDPEATRLSALPVEAPPPRPRTHPYRRRAAA
jgi:plasmid stabilization system protein ParE